MEEANNSQNSEKIEKEEPNVVAVETNNIENQGSIVKEASEDASSAPVADSSKVENSFDSILEVDNSADEKKNSPQSNDSEGKNELNSSNTSNQPQSATKNNNSKNVVIAILVVAVIILAWFWQGNSKNNGDKNVLDKGNNKESVVVSDKKEQGTVEVVEGGSSTLLGIDSGIPLSTNQAEITAYFGNIKENKNMTDCSIVFPLRRIIEKKYDSDMVNAVKGLLQPLSADEMSQGFISSVPKETMLKYVKVSSGVAEVNFSVGLNQIGGSCAVTAARAQIEKTLLQFPGVKSVIICVEGNCRQDLILQP